MRARLQGAVLRADRTVEAMPELAEVELLRRQLDQLIGSVVVSCRTDGSPRFAQAAGCVGRIAATARRGKVIGVALEAGDRSPQRSWLHIGLGMTGQLLGPDAERPARRRVTWDLGADGELVLADVRGFGSVTVSNAPPVRVVPEPGDTSFPDHLATKLVKSGAPVFNRLLDQSIAPGVGSYLAQESLWRTGTDPASRSVSEEHARSLASALSDVVTEALLHGGMTMRDYRHLDGSKGSMFQRLQCYGRHGSPCLRCGTEMERVVIGGRGVTYCPTCQH